MNSQLTVVVRVRPLNKNETDRKHFQCVFQLDEKRLLLVDPEKYEANALRQHRQHERQFTFDAAFGPKSTQEEVYAKTTGSLIDSVLAGYNATVFAYGATGSGKTHTMIGTKEQPGVMTLLIKSLYERMSDDYQVQLSYMEIYNEVIRDLLNPNSGVLDLLEDDKGNILVPGLSTVRAPNIVRVMQLLQEGNQRRTQEATGANKTSSRSHALLQAMILRNNRTHAKLFLIDLAGSERASNTNNRGQRLKEGAAINRSLLALGNVINSLTSGNRRGYVNYRDSKLTRLLKDSLGGKANTCMIAHVTAASGHYEETYNTLVYAARAKNIVNKPARHRPASADDSYADKLKQIRKSYESNMIPHASSSNQISDRISPEQRQPSLPRWNNSKNVAYPRRTAQESDRRDFSSLFTQLKEQLISLSEKQNNLREHLMHANQESYEVEMGIVSKSAIISAWEKQHGDQKPAESIQRIKEDVDQLKEQSTSLFEQRRKLEKALRKGIQTSQSIESRLRGLASTKEQRELVDLVVRMADIQAEKISAVNDLAIQSLLMKKTDNSMSKLQKYEMIADKLIEGRLEDKDREQLEHEYRIIKNQFHYHLIPLKQMNNIVSWNSQLLPKLGSAATTDDVERLRKSRSKKRDSLQLPIISNDCDKNRANSIDSQEDLDGLKLPRL